MTRMIDSEVRYVWDAADPNAGGSLRLDSNAGRTAVALVRRYTDRSTVDIGKWRLGENGKSELQIALPLEASIVFGAIQRGICHVNQTIAYDRLVDLREQLAVGVQHAADFTNDPAMTSLAEQMQNVLVNETGANSSSKAS